MFIDIASLMINELFRFLRAQMFECYIPCNCNSLSLLLLLPDQTYFDPQNRSGEKIKYLD